jgi:Fic family protein
MNVRNIPFNDLPLLPPKDTAWRDIDVYEKLVQARTSLAELKGRLPIIPNALMLINTLVMQEAKDSSTIENIFTTNDKLYKAFISQSSHTDSATKEVLRYREAMWGGFHQLKEHKKLTKELLIYIFQTITQRNEGIRTKQVWIGNNQNQIIYTPPEIGKYLDEKITNWLEFANTHHPNVDPLVKMAILHYQFEAIHPFTDGNGRTGRILNILYLCYENLLDIPILYHSKFIIKHKNDYYRLLREVTENQNWKEWLCFILDSIKETSIDTLNKVNQIYDAYLKTIELVKTNAKYIYSHELIEIIFSQPYCKISILENKQIANRKTASKYLRKLEELGILDSEQIGKEIIYKNKELYRILSI